ncbi:MAG TPA: branched-chain amino acid ABC transporter permease [Candidatus Limnocylindrales bacterium]|nr:branched-chain amino acid ABC transporter permease [Candidatus Limnocylindrales bacterium]
MSFLEYIIQQLINGLTIGAVYALIALGYTMVYGIIELINFAHGEIYMIGAYIGIITLGVLSMQGLTQNSLALAMGIVLVVSMVYCAAYGFTMERIAYRPLRQAPRLSPLITALGMSIFLQNYVMLTQGARDKFFPPLFTGGINIDEVRISYIQVFIMVISVLLMIALQLFIKNTRLGKAMRATAQDKKMASLVGINIDRVISITFIIGSSLAAVAGIMVGMYYGLVNFYIGYVAGLKAFTAAVLGGVGNIAGAMLGGFLLGLLEAFAAGFIPPPHGAQYKDVFAFAILVLVLIFRPSGLLGEQVAEKI